MVVISLTDRSPRSDETCLISKIFLPEFYAKTVGWRPIQVFFNARRYAATARARNKSGLKYAGSRVRPRFVEPVNHLQGGERHLAVPIAKSGGSHP